MNLSDTAAANRDRDIQLDGNRLSMTTVQLERAALRLTMKTRLATGDAKAGVADRGDDAALVAQAFLDLKREVSDSHSLVHLAAQQRLKEKLETEGVTLKMHPSIQLASGVYYDFTDPCSTPLSIEDIAAGLSRVCRYTGQLGNHVDDNAVYTVAQHSVLASENCEPGHELAALLHDATESVMNDMASPLKQLLPCYKALERSNEAAIFQTFGLPVDLSSAVKRIDLIMLATEKRDLMPRIEGDEKWTMLEGVDPLPFIIRPWSPAEARARFLHRFAFLTEGVLPKPGENHATPHENAPAAYVDAFLRAYPSERVYTAYDRSPSFSKSEQRCGYRPDQAIPPFSERAADYGVAVEDATVDPLWDLPWIAIPGAAYSYHRTDREDGVAPPPVEITAAPAPRPSVAALAASLLAAVSEAGVSLLDVIDAAATQAQIDLAS